VSFALVERATVVRVVVRIVVTDRRLRRFKLTDLQSAGRIFTRFRQMWLSPLTCSNLCQGMSPDAYLLPASCDKAVTKRVRISAQFLADHYTDQPLSFRHPRRRSGRGDPLAATCQNFGTE
jgi:hypothetical protein